MNSSRSGEGATTAWRNECHGGCHAVIILNYFGRDDTLRCIESFGDDGDLHLVVTDNGSFDGTLEAVPTLDGQLTTLQTGENLGFAGGMNVGIDWALHHGAHVITILNNDTILHRGALERSRQMALEGWAVSPMIVYDADPERVWFAGGTVDAGTNLARHLQDHELLPAPGQRPTEILAGCCVTASRETWTRVGGFDADYFLNFEDSDWSIRARRAGIPLMVDTETTIRHKVSQSFRREFSYLGLYFYVRNGAYLGRCLLDGEIAQTYGFFRRHVIPIIAGSVRSRQYGQALRQAVTVSAGLSDFARGRRGHAPQWLQRLARSWGASSP